MKAPDKKKPRGRRWKTGAGRLLSAVLLAAIMFPPYRPLAADGDHDVRVQIKYFRDEQREETYGTLGGPRLLAAEFWYPAGKEEKFPLVIFSHGALATRRSNESLFIKLASHGYVVCSIDHSFQSLLTGIEGRRIYLDTGYLGELRGENAKKNRRESLVLYQKWMGVRLGDMAFVLDAVTAPPARNDELYGRIDPSKVSFIGHSLGGAAAMGMGRRQAAAKAVIALEAPMLCDLLDVRDDEFVLDLSPYPVPLMQIYTDSAWDRLDDWPQYAGNARLLSEQDDQTYSLHMEGMGHLGLTDLALASPLLTRLLDGRTADPARLDEVNALCLSFLDRYVKGFGEKNEAD